MRTVVQRVSSAAVVVDGVTVGEIERGFCLLVGIGDGDGPEEIEAAVEKISGLRLFPDDRGRMNRSLADVGGEVLVVSQFTLLGDVRRGRRPSFTAAAAPDVAAPLIDSMVEQFRARGTPTAQGAFGEYMSVQIHNDGPVTVVIDVIQGRVV
jgi:D-tyrosyl-tRNA(Tyr) deacylase